MRRVYFGVILRSVWIGFDPREAAAFAVCRHSLRRHASKPINVHGLVLADVEERGLYTRPIEYRQSAADRPLMWDVISDAAMSTQHANARFLVPHLAKEGWALFCDGDILWRGDVHKLFDQLEPSKAVYCVKHNYAPAASIKMDGQVQTNYGRKNWSSVMVFNCGHPANRSLTLGLIDRAPGRELHALCWLADCDIGELGPEWNYLVGHTKLPKGVEPVAVHMTSGTPDMPGYENCEYADEWRAELNRWAA